MNQCRMYRWGIKVFACAGTTQQVLITDLNTLLNKLAQEPVLKPNRLKIGQTKIKNHNKLIGQLVIN